MAKKKLELTWPNKDKVLLRLEKGKPVWGIKEDIKTRILIKQRHYGDPSSENILIKGDNLLALKALEPKFGGKIKLIYIDPPFNTGNAFEQYDDGLEHTIWLSLMRDRLSLLWDLLANDGSLYIHLDFNMVHYCKVIMDEIFGKNNFQREIIWRIGWVSGFKTQAKNYIRNHDTILYYTKGENFTFNKIYIPYSKDYRRRDGSKPTGKGYPMEDTWNCSIIDRLDSIQIKSFSREKTGFYTQKSEDLLCRIISVSSNPGDIVLDSFAGSGTTGAVAHQIGRRWIMVEIEDSADKYIIPRMKRIIEGKPPYKKSYGGGFTYYTLGESVVGRDSDTGVWVLNYTNGPLIEAVCLAEGYQIIADGDLHGRKGKRYAHVTEDYVTQNYIDGLLALLGEDEAVTIYCTKYSPRLKLPKEGKVIIKKIPKALLRKG